MNNCGPGRLATQSTVRLDALFGLQILRGVQSDDSLCLHGADLRVCHRACGGNDVLHVFKGAKAGLSLRVRGNPCDEPLWATQMRSIPARTGEPQTVEGGTDRDMEAYVRAGDQQALADRGGYF